MMELIEQHAYDTYDTYLNAHAEDLKVQPAPQIAINYYPTDAGLNRKSLREQAKRVKIVVWNAALPLNFLAFFAIQ